VTADRPARLAGWPDALARGALAFLVVAAVGQALALAVWVVGDTGASLAAFVRIGWMYVGAFHHVAIELDVPDLDVNVTGPGATSLSLGVALLTITGAAMWLLSHEGRAVADRVGGGPLARLWHGAKVAPGYALPAFALAAIVEVRTPLRLGAFASGELHVALSTWQALVFPLAIAAAAGVVGGLRSSIGSRDPEARPPPVVAAAVAGGWRMFALAIVLSLAGLFVVGVVRPDGPEALLTPSTARYWRAVLDRPAPGLVLLGHHLALAPNEALWALVPAMGGCVGVRGSASADVLCYGRFPTAVGTTLQPLTPGEAVPLPLGDTTFARAPIGYALFLLVPIVATTLGGRRAAERHGTRGREAVGVGWAAGVVFAGLVTAGALLSTVTIGYGAAFGEGSSAGWVIVGPNVVTAGLLALAWGVVGGVFGAVTSGWGRDLRSREPDRSSRGAAPTEPR
jgi:hypothetical protein